MASFFVVSSSACWMNPTQALFEITQHAHFVCDLISMKTCHCFGHDTPSHNKRVVHFLETWHLQERLLCSRSTACAWYTREILLKSDTGRGNWQVGLLVLTWRENSLPNYAELINLNSTSASVRWYPKQRRLSGKSIIDLILLLPVRWNDGSRNKTSCP